MPSSIKGCHINQNDPLIFCSSHIFAWNIFVIQKLQQISVTIKWDEHNKDSWEVGRKKLGLWGYRGAVKLALNCISWNFYHLKKKTTTHIYLSCLSLYYLSGFSVTHGQPQYIILTQCILFHFQMTKLRYLEVKWCQRSSSRFQSWRENSDFLSFFFFFSPRVFSL